MVFATLEGDLKTSRESSWNIDSCADVAMAGAAAAVSAAVARAHATVTCPRRLRGRIVPLQRRRPREVAERAPDPAPAHSPGPPNVPADSLASVSWASTTLRFTGSLSGRS